MKRIHGFKVLTLQFGLWIIVTKAGQWQLLPEMIPRGVALEPSWHRIWNQAVTAYEEVLRKGSDEEVVVLSKKGVVLGVVCRNALERQLLDSIGNPQWKSVGLNTPSIIAASDSPVFFNKNQTGIAWVELSGAEQEVPCSLSFLERRARQNPDGFYGRLLARQNEVRDYFRPG